MDKAQLEMIAERFRMSVRELMSLMNGAGKTPQRSRTQSRGSVGSYRPGAMMPQMTMTSGYDDYDQNTKYSQDNALRKQILAFMKDQEKYNRTRADKRSDTAASNKRDTQKAILKEVNARMQPDRRHMVDVETDGKITQELTEISYMTPEQIAATKRRVRADVTKEYASLMEPDRQQKPTRSAPKAEELDNYGESYKTPGKLRRGSGWVKIEEGGLKSPDLEDGEEGRRGGRYKAGTEFFMNEKGQTVRIEPNENGMTSRVTGIVNGRDLNSDIVPREDVENFKRQRRQLPERKMLSKADKDMMEDVTDVGNATGGYVPQGIGAPATNPWEQPQTQDLPKTYPPNEGMGSPTGLLPARQKSHTPDNDSRRDAVRSFYKPPSEGNEPIGLLPGFKKQNDPTAPSMNEAMDGYSLPENPVAQRDVPPGIGSPGKDPWSRQDPSDTQGLKEMIMGLLGNKEDVQGIQEMLSGLFGYDSPNQY